MARTGRRVTIEMSSSQESDIEKRVRIKAEFLQAYRERLRVDKAAEDVGIARCTIYAWRKDDPQFRADMDDVRELIAQSLEDEAYRRAVEGVERPTTIAGAREVVREWSDTLCIFLLKAARPERFRERYDVRSDSTVRHEGEVKIYMPDNGRGEDDDGDGE